MRFKLIDFFRKWNFKTSLIIIFLTSSLLAAPGFHEPWGKDSDLKKEEPFIQKKSELSLLGEGFKKIIQFHQTVLSPVDGPRSHFRPSSSTYMKLAIQKHGALKGFIMGCDRLLRENNETWIYPVQEIEGEAWKIDFPP